MSLGKRLEVFGKRLATQILTRVLVGASEEVLPPSVDAIRSVLFVRPNFRMGNMLMVTPAIQAVRKALPHVHVGLLTTSAYAHMLKDDLVLNRVHVLTRNMGWMWWPLVRLLRDIRSMKYDLVVDCSEGESLLGAAFIVFSKAPYRLGPVEGKQAAVFNLRPSMDGGSKHRIVRLLFLLEYVGIGTNNYSMRLDLNEAEHRWANSRWERWGFDSGVPVVGINLGARGEKRWSLANFKMLIDCLLDQSCRILLFAGPQELDRLGALEDILPAEVRIDTTHDPRRFAALIANCSVFVTADTGPMHLAVAVGTPTVAIFTRSNYEVYGPLGSRHRVVFDPNNSELESVLSSVVEILESQLRTQAQ